MRRDKQRQQGLAVVEFAIILPFIIVVALVVSALGRGLYQYNTLNKAVHNGARYLSDNAIGPTGTIDSDTWPGYQVDTENLVIYGNVDGTGDSLLREFVSKGGTVEVDDVYDVPISGGVPSIHVRVTATYPFNSLFDLSALGDFTMTASVTERALKL